MVFSRLNPSLPPNFHEMDEYTFQEMCRDLFSEEPGVITCDVYGKRGQRQYGIDLLARLADQIHAVGQCKCYEDFPPRKIREASDEFFAHLDYWQQRNVNRFILFVGCQLDETQRQEEISIQTKRFAEQGIDYEVWTATTLRRRLAPHPEIVYCYLRSRDWVEVICGISQISTSSALQENTGTAFTIGILTAKVDRLSSDLSRGKAQQLEEYRELYRQGHLQKAFTTLEALRDDEHWDVFEPALQAQILQSLAGYALGVEHQIEKAKALIQQAQTIDPDVNVAITQVLVQYHVEGAEAALALIGDPLNLDLYNLKLGLLLELGQADQVVRQLQSVALPFEIDAETNRIYALALLEQGDIAGALVKIQQARHDKSNWEKVRATEATINYFSVLSPAIAPRLTDLPVPVEWLLIKRDDESLKRLRMAAAEFSQLAVQTERGNSQRNYWTVWQLACLANDVDRQKEAQELCQTLLNQDPTHPQAIAWSTVRCYEIDLGANRQALEDLVQHGSQDLERIIALLGLYLQLELSTFAIDLLNTKRQLFEQRGHLDIWQFWYVQALSMNADFEGALQAIETLQDTALKRDLRVTILREQTQMNQDWQALSDSLESCWHDSQNVRYLYEACQLQASLQNWAYIADRAEALLKLVATSEALGLVAQAAWQTGRFRQCYQLLNHHLQLYFNRLRTGLFQTTETSNSLSFSAYRTCQYAPSRCRLKSPA